MTCTKPATFKSFVCGLSKAFFLPFPKGGCLLRNWRSSVYISVRSWQPHPSVCTISHLFDFYKQQDVQAKALSLTMVYPPTFVHFGLIIRRCRSHYLSGNCTDSPLVQNSAFMENVQKWCHLDQRIQECRFLRLWPPCGYLGSQFWKACPQLKASLHWVSSD